MDKSLPEFLGPRKALKRRGRLLTYNHLPIPHQENGNSPTRSMAGMNGEVKKRGVVAARWDECFSKCLGPNSGSDVSEMGLFFRSETDSHSFSRTLKKIAPSEINQLLGQPSLHHVYYHLGCIFREHGSGHENCPCCVRNCTKKAKSQKGRIKTMTNDF